MADGGNGMGKLNFRWAINQALDEEMTRDAKVVLLGEDIGRAGGTFGLTRGLYEKYGEWRVKDSPLSEEGLMGTAVGLAIAGYRPVIEIMFMDFITIAMEQLVNQAAKTYFISGGKITIPLVVRTLGGGGFRGGSHHSQSLEAWFTHVPGLKVVYPSNPEDAKGLLKSAIRDDHPVLFIEHKSLLGFKGEAPDGEYTIPIGKAKIVCKGEHLTILSYGKMVHLCLEGANELKKKGIKAEVIDIRTLLPLDVETIIESVKKTNHVLIVHEAAKNSGFGAEISALISEQAIYDLDAPVKRLAGLFSTIPVGDAEDFLYPTVLQIIQTAEELVL